MSEVAIESLGGRVCLRNQADFKKRVPHPQPLHTVVSITRD